MRKKKLYRVIDETGATVLTTTPGTLAGWNGGRPDRKIYGLLTCASGMRMKKRNRVFFSSVQAALAAGYRPCKICKPPTA